MYVDSAVRMKAAGLSNNRTRVLYLIAQYSICMITHMLLLLCYKLSLQKISKDIYIYIVLVSIFICSLECSVIFVTASDGGRKSETKLSSNKR